VDWRDDRASRRPDLPGFGPERAVPHDFVVWLSDGTIFEANPPPGGEEPGPPILHRGRPVSRLRGNRREVAIRGPAGTTILVSRDVDRDLAELDRLAGRLAAVGLGVFAVGLLGGWWLSGRAVRPIEAMGRTAEGITARTLSDRIDLAGIDQEFERLGSTLNAMLDRLESAFERQMRFTADASHELRTPLSVILTHAELAMARPRSAEEYRESLGTCRRAAGRMKALVEDLLTLARADAGQLDLKRGAVDLRGIALDHADQLGPLAESRGVRVEVLGDHVRVLADATRLGQVVTNLLSNAITYNRPGIAGSSTSPTPVLVFPRLIAPTSLTASTGSTWRGRGRPAAAAWGCRSARVLSRRSAARSAFPPSKGRGPRSRSGSPERGLSRDRERRWRRADPARRSPTSSPGRLAQRAGIEGRRIPEPEGGRLGEESLRTEAAVTRSRPSRLER
jgi:signal transduction histidine kinase